MSKFVEIRAPAKESEGTRSQLLRWLKTVGERVAENEPLIELETDKVTVEIPAPASGVLREILRQPEEEVGPGELLGRIEQGATAGEATTPPPPRGAVAGSGPQIRTAIAAAASAASPGRTLLSPAVRRLLTEHALDAAAVRGSGLGGRITVEDVLHAAQASAQPADVPAAADAPASRLVAHTPMRKRIAQHMVHSLLQTAPHVTSVFEADLTAVNAHRSRHREDFERGGAPLTFTAYFLSAAAAAMRAVPQMNSRWTDEALEVFESVNIGIATALGDEGLVVPVLPRVERRDLFEIAQGLNDLVTRARAGSLTPADVRGGTFTISNHGVSGSLIATPIVINQPQSAILGVGKLEKRAAVVLEEGVERLAIRPRCYVTLTIDHRALDGHQANRYLSAFVQSLQSWPL